MYFCHCRPVGQRAASHVVHVNIPQRLASSAIASCACACARKRTFFPVPPARPHSAPRRETSECLLKIDNVYAVAFAENIFLHLGSSVSSGGKVNAASSNSFIVISTPKYLPFLKGCLDPAIPGQHPFLPVACGREIVRPIGPDRICLRFAELESAARALLPVLLAFLMRESRVRKHSFERGTQSGIQLRQRARQPHAHRSRLPTHSAALYLRLHFQLDRASA